MRADRPNVIRTDDQPTQAHPVTLARTSRAPICAAYRAADFVLSTRQILGFGLLGFRIDNEPNSGGADKIYFHIYGPLSPGLRPTRPSCPRGPTRVARPPDVKHMGLDTQTLANAKSLQLSVPVWTSATRTRLTATPPYCCTHTDRRFTALHAYYAMSLGTVLAGANLSGRQSPATAMIRPTIYANPP